MNLVFIVYMKDFYKLFVIILNLDFFFIVLENIFSDNYDVVFLLDLFGVIRSVFEDMKIFVY